MCKGLESDMCRAGDAQVFAEQLQLVGCGRIQVPADPEGACCTQTSNGYEVSRRNSNARGQHSLLSLPRIASKCLRFPAHRIPLPLPIELVAALCNWFLQDLSLHFGRCRAADNVAAAAQSPSAPPANGGLSQWPAAPMLNEQARHVTTSKTGPTHGCYWR